MTFTLDPDARPIKMEVAKDGGGVFVIMNVTAVLAGTRAPQQCKIFGTLSVIVPYYLYQYTYERRDTKYGPTYYLRALKASRPVQALRYPQLKWMLRHELKLPASAVARLLQCVPAGQTTGMRGDALLACLPPDVRHRLRAESAYFRETSVSRLGRWLPHVAPPVLEERLGSLAAADRAALEDLAERAPWRLALRAPTRRWRACGLPAPVSPAFQAALAAFAPDPTADERRPTAAELQAAVALEERLRARQKRTKDTVFLREDAVPRILNDDTGEYVEDSAAVRALALLLAAEAVEVRTVAGRQVYARAGHAEVRRRLLDGLRALYTRNRTQHGPWAPGRMATTEVCTRFGLCAEQYRPLQQAVAEPLTCVTGGPGVGKTRVIEALCERFADAFVAVRTLTGSMAAALRERGLAGAATLHRGLRRLEQLAAWEATPGGEAHEPPPEAELERRVQVLVIDELSNVPEKLLARILGAYPALLRLIVVFDPDQIPPIGPGQPAVDLLEALPRPLVTHLHTNHRVAGHARCLVENDRALLRRRFGDLQLAAFLAIDGRPEPEALARLRATGTGIVDVADLEQPATLRQALTWTLQHLVCGGRRPTVGDLGSVLFIALMNTQRRAINAHIEALVAPPGRPWLYPGKRLTVTDRNYARQEFREVRSAPGWTPYPAEVAAAAPKRPPHLVSDEVCNGELFLFRELCDYDTKARRWGRVRSRLAAREGLQPPGHVLRVLRMAGGQQIVVGGADQGASATQTAGVAPAHLQAAWCITVDKAQGRQEQTVVKVLPPPVSPSDAPARRARYAQCFRRNHAHVSLSRAKQCYLQIGGLRWLQELARRAPRPRLTLLAHDLRALLEDPVTTPRQLLATRLERAHARTRPVENDAALLTRLFDDLALLQST